MTKRRGRSRLQEKMDLKRRAAAGFRGYPVATVAYYGPTGEFATKAVVGIVRREGGDVVAMKKWFLAEGDTTDARLHPTISREIVEYIEAYRVKSVVMAPAIIGCPHEAGVDYPEGEECPHCPWWIGREPWTGEVAGGPGAGRMEMVTAVGWYRKEQWGRLLEIAADRDELHDTYEEWVEAAEEAIRELRGRGIALVKVDVDVEELRAWCQVQGYEVDGEARAGYAAARLRERT